MDNLENKTENETKSIMETLKSAKKSKRIKNELLFKKGGVSLAVTALFIVAVILFNILIGALSDRFVLEYDFSKDKVTTLNKDNIEYIKKLDKDVSVIVCSDEDSYVDYVSYAAQNSGLQFESTGYFEQTQKLIKKYASYNKKIDVKFVNPNSSEFTEIGEKYSSKIKNPGDIIVISKATGTERSKVLGLSDIYDVTTDDSYAQMGYSTSIVTGNNIENALTGAISYVLNSDKKIAVLTGHSTKDYTKDYVSMLKQNNFTVDTVSNKLITKISDEYAEIVIPVADIDFSDDEISVISEFLINGGKYGKGLTVFTDASAPYLPVLYDFLDEWGITAEEGKLFETNGENHMENDPSTFASVDEGQTTLCVSSANVPLIASEKTNGCTVTSVIATSGTTIAVPKNTPNNFTGADKYEKKTYSTVIRSEKGATVVDATDANPPKSYVTALSSSYFLQSEYNENAMVSNKNVALNVTENNSGAEKSDIQFVTKTITNESFSEKVTQSKVTTVRIIFIFVIPIIVLALGIFVYIRRRNAA